MVKPLQLLLSTFHGPVRLIQKRQDKHLDYSASMQKAEKNRDPAKAKAVSQQIPFTNGFFFVFKMKLLLQSGR